MQAIPPDQVVFVDETGMDDNDVWQYGWSAKGERCFSLVSGKRTTRVSLIAGERHGELIAPFMFEGYCNAAVFEAYVEHILLPELKPGQVVVIDNARFHQSLITRQLIEKNAGCILKFLPPYLARLKPHRASLVSYQTSYPQNPAQLYRHPCRSTRRAYIIAN